MAETFEELPRNQRRIALRNEQKARTSGNWGPWNATELPMGMPGSMRGWTASVRRVHANRVWSVLERPLPDGAVHLAVSSLSGARPTWWEMQRLKDEIAGTAATAVEIYPPRDEVIDGANMYHLWVVPDGLPYSLKR
ncbi:hypothetical protein GCM10007913_12000 [Devosia yakushimensis]|uniref:DUF7694 domain-containing protein n=1 Tax=Devosia yakushimensis TaxID=470028 RepID=A0ABQ5UCB0_9HYPH|nr:hypothetical protein [Devosia yakushimensis]GLQ09268.1 hypothetical protein GCM10007913_12000 [Devosia yakushimensis]